MNQLYKPENGRSKFPAQTLLENPYQFSSQRAAEKLKLSQSYLLAEGISNELLRNISINVDFLNTIEVVQLEKYEDIARPEETIHYLYFPETAVVSEFQLLENGKTIEISMTGREGVTNISTVFNSSKTQNFSQVLIPGRSFRINLQFFQKQITDCKFFQKSIYNYVNQYVSQISQRVVCSSHHSTEQRLCSWLLMIVERCGKNTLPLTQEQIARFLGVHRPTVTLITQNLRNDGVINYARGKVVISDLRKLKTRACICYEAVSKSCKF